MEQEVKRMGEVIDFTEYKNHGRWLKMKSPNVDTEGFYGCMAPVEDCQNPASYGVLCVLCNLCGRFEESEEV